MLLTKAQVNAFGSCLERVVKVFKGDDSYTVELLDLSDDDGQVIYFEVGIIDASASRGVKCVKAAFDSFTDAIAYFDAVKDMKKLPKAADVIPEK